MEEERIERLEKLTERIQKLETRVAALEAHLFSPPPLVGKPMPYAKPAEHLEFWHGDKDGNITHIDKDGNVTKHYGVRLENILRK